MNLLYRPFSPLLSHPTLHNFRLYTKGVDQFEVEGALLSKADVKSIPFAERSVSHWRILVDWDLQYQRPFVVIDPFDPSGLLYLTSHEYTVHTRTLARAGISITVIARPGTDKPVPAKNAPEFLCDSLDAISSSEFEFYSKRPLKGGLHYREGISESSSASGFSRVPWSEFTDLRKYISRNVPWGEGQTVNVTHENVMAIMMLWARELLHYLDFKSPGKRIGQLMSFVQHFQTLLRHNGPAFTIARLKISLFCLYSYIGGNPVTDTEPLGQRVRLAKGLPLFIDPRLRSLIRSNHLSVIRLWASLLNSYKAFYGPHGISPLSTIEAPEFKGEVGDFAAFCQGFDNLYTRLEQRCGKQLPEWKYVSGMKTLISSAGANSGQSMSSIRWDLLAWDNASRHLPLEWFRLWKDTRAEQLVSLLTREAKEWLGRRETMLEIPVPQPFTVNDKKEQTIFGKLPKLIARIGKMDEDGEIEPWTFDEKAMAEFRALYEPLSKKGKIGSPVRERSLRIASTDPAKQLAGWQIRDWIEAFRGNGLYPVKHSWRTPIVGRLHSIPEPAGKVRVVAIGDYFSQVALKPLHEYIFSLLRLIPTDATFDQQGAVDAFAAKGHKEIFSYDLKAATDLIPSQLYVEVLIPLIGRKGADLWHSLMKDREWLTPKDIRKDGGKTFVKYTRGQPMGLLSSWAALALVHHALVQFSARKAGLGGWFMEYLVLGDDVVIADAKVAESYLQVCEEFGITVGLAKSLVSKKGLMNFASQTLLGNDNISPVSLGEELVALNWDRRKEMARRICHRYVGRNFSDSAFLRRVLTTAQWAALQGQLTGRVVGTFSRYIEFILRNPFVVKTEDVQIGHVLDWLGMLIPSLTGASSLRDEISKALEVSLLYFVQETYTKKVKDWKDCLSASQRLIGGGPFSDWDNNHFWRYLAECLMAHFEEAGRDLDSIGIPLMKMNPAAPLPEINVLLDWYRTLEAIPPLASLFGPEPRLGVWNVLKGTALIQDLPKPVRTGKLGAVVGRFTAPKPKDSLRAPLEPLTNVIGRVLGMKLPAYELVRRRPTPSFFKTLIEEMKNYETKIIARDTSPCFNKVAVTVRVPIQLPAQWVPGIPTWDATI